MNISYYNSTKVCRLVRQSWQRSGTYLLTPEKKKKKSLSDSKSNMGIILFRVRNQKICRRYKTKSETGEISVKYK